MPSILQHLRYSVRLLLKSPGFTITAILILGFGIGTNAAIFSLVEAFILKPLPYRDADRLVQFYLTYQGNENSIDYPDYLDISATQRSFDSLSIVSNGTLVLTGRGDPETLEADFVSASMFKVTKRPFILGRPFNEKEDIPDGPLLIVLSEHCWRTRFNADPEIVGKSLTLGDRAFEVVGVVPEQINYWKPSDVYVPINAFPAFDVGLWKRDSHIAACFGRLKPGIDLSQAQSDLEGIHNSLINLYPDTDKGYGIRVVSLRDYSLGDYSQTIWLLGAGVGFLFIVSSANIASLMVARAMERKQEMTVRLILGARRKRLLAQLLCETTLLTLLGGVLGLVVAKWLLEIIKNFSLQSTFRFQHGFHEVSLDIWAFLYCVGIDHRSFIDLGDCAGLEPFGFKSRPYVEERRGQGRYEGTKQAKNAIHINHSSGCHGLFDAHLLRSH